jgi:hypothetical protein
MSQNSSSQSVCILEQQLEEQVSAVRLWNLIMLAVLLVHPDDREVETDLEVVLNTELLGNGPIF